MTHFRLLYCYIFNSRQMGKSFLCVRTMEHLQQEGYAGAINSLVKQFQLTDRFNFRQWWRDLSDRPIPSIQRFANFIETILLEQITAPIVIFIDEIDSLRSLDFSADDFLMLIRAFYEKHTRNAACHRLTFALIGVTTPIDLITDRNRSSFNIGTTIEMGGFTFDEAQDVPKHLGTLQERILRVDQQSRGRLFGLYQQVLLEDGIPANESIEQMQLRLTGLVVKKSGQLQVYNPIYAAVHNHIWVAQNLSDIDEQFLQASRQQETANKAAALAVEQERAELLEEANETLTNAKCQADRRICLGSIFLAIILIGGLAAVTWAFTST
ncbi:AAA-like domain-containing protein [filamentous cyanobacterium LEGE 11480]|uniref:AAA-like domain-containing protein n=1 Tax=Romeriopsis navalis LEGE 11480 TaxID=2777977 RepID=A0A928VWK5_9CYAN|nr:AAA-like domain-containing protein [Romeriopsis navalis]MBE9033494.1 AAA-like domain-containing protein [Romeriopsis navalis LEGE 11480]